ncbi:zinc ABC transporter substrate-binding protein [Jannaschia sp. M317]|uniref:zinc ABC transporter substrate-binding protein n=1 Tax=Jannaschia sp. M317 TaxID=2867011 RepID=UPI0021A68B97|nr:zinc ABC transporter substrate-binding protein [Jannaschia sp. M317]UWQ17752.1 zinc ABC transporter substrate-binding protein [Jannaschia sp. M317]
MIRTFLLPACLAAAPAFADAPRVATDILPVHGLVSRVMAGVGVPDLVVPADASPHGHAMRPSEAAALEAADVVVWIGPALTPWLDGALDTLAADAQRVTLLDLDGTALRAFGDDHDDHDHEAASDPHGHEDHGDHAGHDDHADHDADHEDHSDHKDHDHDAHGHAASAEGHGSHDDHGHDHAGGVDPHAWLDPVNGKLWLAQIADVLATVDPENAATYRANATAGQAELTAVEVEIETLLAPLRGRGFLTFHDAYGYFEARFDVPSSGSIRLGDATSPGAAHVAELRDRVASEGIVCLFSEPQFDPGLAATVAEGNGVRLAVLDPTGAAQAPGPQQYPALLRALAQNMADCLAP